MTAWTIKLLKRCITPTLQNTMMQRQEKIHFESLEQEAPEAVKNAHFFSLKNILIGGAVAVVAVSMVLVFIYRETVIFSKGNSIHMSPSKENEKESHKQRQKSSTIEEDSTTSLQAPTPLSPAPAPIEPKVIDNLIFYRTSNANIHSYEMCSVDSDGTNLNVIIPSIQVEDYNFSVDGKTMVYVKDRGIYTKTINNGGSDQKLVFKAMNVKPRDPSFSSKGDKIVFIDDGKDRKSVNQLFVIDSNGKNLKQLSHPEEAFELCSGPVFTPDGKFIVAFNNSSVGFEYVSKISMTDANTGKIVKNFKFSSSNVKSGNSVFDNVFVSAFSISPDGAKLAVICIESSDISIRIVNINENEKDSNDSITISKTKNTITSLKWSSDGNYIYFSEFYHDENVKDYVLAAKSVTGTGEVEYLKDKDDNCIRAWELKQVINKVI